MLFFCGFNDFLWGFCRFNLFLLLDNCSQAQITRKNRYTEINIRINVGGFLFKFLRDEIKTIINRNQWTVKIDKCSWFGISKWQNKQDASSKSIKIQDERKDFQGIGKGEIHTISFNKMKYWAFFMFLNVFFFFLKFSSSVKNVKVW